MNLFGKKKLVVIQDLIEIDNSVLMLSKEVQQFKEQCDGLNAQLAGKHITTEYCNVCEHRMQTQFTVVGMPPHLCDLDCHCADFKRK